MESGECRIEQGREGKKRRGKGEEEEGRSTAVVRPTTRCPQVRAGGMGEMGGGCWVGADRDNADLEGRIIQSALAPDTP